MGNRNTTTPSTHQRRERHPPRAASAVTSVAVRKGGLPDMPEVAGFADHERHRCLMVAPMPSLRPIRVLAAAGVAAAAVLAALPAQAQPGYPVVFQAALPGDSQWSPNLHLPAKLMFTKTRGSKQVGKKSFASVVATLTRWHNKGRSVFGVVTIGGKSRDVKGLPVLMGDGTVKVRIAQARGTRAVSLPRSYSSSVTFSSIPPRWDCPPPMPPGKDCRPPGTYVCVFGQWRCEAPLGPHPWSNAARMS